MTPRSCVRAVVHGPVTDFRTGAGDRRCRRCRERTMAAGRAGALVPVPGDPYRGVRRGNRHGCALVLHRTNLASASRSHPPDRVRVGRCRSVLTAGGGPSHPRYHTPGVAGGVGARGVRRRGDLRGTGQRVLRCLPHCRDRARDRASEPDRFRRGAAAHLLLGDRASPRHGVDTATGDAPRRRGHHRPDPRNPIVVSCSTRRHLSSARLFHRPEAAVSGAGPARRTTRAAERLVHRRPARHYHEHLRPRPRRSRTGRGGRERDRIDLGQPALRGFTARQCRHLAQDVPAWITTHLQVDRDPTNWAIGGLSLGGTCALQMATNYTDVYPTFLDLSGDPEPTLGDHQRPWSSPSAAVSRRSTRSIR